MHEENGKELCAERIDLESMDDAIGVFGVFDENIPIFEEETGVRIRIRSDGICMEGTEESVSLGI